MRKYLLEKMIFPESSSKVLQEYKSAEPLNHYDDNNTTDLNEYLLDRHNHLIVKHDLFNHDGLTQDGIAEAFIEFAKKEDLSFVRDQISKKS